MGKHCVNNLLAFPSIKSTGNQTPVALISWKFCDVGAGGPDFVKISVVMPGWTRFLKKCHEWVVMISQKNLWCRGRNFTKKLWCCRFAAPHCMCLLHGTGTYFTVHWYLPSVSTDMFSQIQFTTLFEQTENISMKSCSLDWHWREIFRENLAISYSGSWNISTTHREKRITNIIRL